MAERTTPGQPSPPRSGSESASELAELRGELTRSRAEVERLRELLIAKDLEMGKVRGRLEQLEERTNRILGAAVRLRRFGPAFARFRASLRRSRDRA